MNKQKKDIVSTIIMILLLFVALGSGVVLASKLVAKSRNTAELESLITIVEHGASYEEYEKIQKQEEPDLEDIQQFQENRLEGYAELQQQNSDMIGWLYVPGSRIDYPVMQSLDFPDFYLKHGFDKKSTSYGIPYVAESCDLTGECNNIIIYGHHMKDGSMFTDLMKYQKESYYNSYPIIYFDTMEEMGKYQIIGALKVPAITAEEEFYKKMQTATQFDYSSYVAEVKRRSYYETGEIAVYGEQLLTLITCEYSEKEGRFIVVAKKLED